MPGRRYRMPTHFCPAPGPRQTLDGGRYECRDDPRQVIAHAAYAAEVDQLDAFMPPGFVVRRGEIAATFCYMTEVAWLASRCYNTFGETVPATWTDGAHPVHGVLIVVPWDTYTNTVFSGRRAWGLSQLFF